MEKINQSQATEAFESLIAKAQEDASFREALISNPRETIRNEVNIGFDENVKIVVRDQTDASTAYINIPRQPDIDALELTDEQLEMVAGGDITLGVVLVYAGCSLLVGAAIGLGAAYIANN
jgi:hypothetical protein